MSRFCATHGWGTWRPASAATSFSPAFEPVLAAQPDLMIRVAGETAVLIAGFAANPDRDRALSEERRQLEERVRVVDKAGAPGPAAG